jgi:hypothetical protein
MMQLHFDEELHQYEYNGRVIPSVTQILSSVGVKNEKGFWSSVSGAEHMPDDDTAALFGSEFHKYPEARLQGWDIEVDPAMQPWCEQWEQWLLHNHGIAPMMHEGKPLIEMPMFHRHNIYAGTPDFVARDRIGKPWIIDWKTSTAKQAHWWLQLAAYAELVQHWIGERIQFGLWTVRVESGRYYEEKVLPKSTATYFNKFCSVNNVYQMAA